MSKMTGGTARMLSRRPTPASQSRPAATQNSRMALPAATYSALVKHASATQSVDSPPPCGEGFGVDVLLCGNARASPHHPHPGAGLRPSPQGVGYGPSCPLVLPPPTRFLSRRALEPRERFVDLEAARLGCFALLALAFDYVLRRARDEVGIGELGVDAGDVGFN